MFKSLYGKLVAILLVLILALGIFFIWLSLFTTESYFREVNQRLNHDLADHLASEWELLRGGEVNTDHLKEVFHTLMIANPSIECYLLDSEGNIIAYDAPDEKIKRESVSLEPINDFLDGEKSTAIVGDDPRDVNRKKVFSVSPIEVDGQREGYLYVILGGEDYEGVADLIGDSYTMSLSVWVALGSVAVALLVGVIAFSMLTSRLRKLTDAVNAFKRSDFSNIDPLRLSESEERGDEIDQLADVFQGMAGRIINHIEELKRIDSERREMVGSVSHDLRAPLTTLQGHLETMLVKEQQLDAEERHNFLTASIAGCRRLNRLVESLFELAKLDSYSFTPQLEDFSLDELTHDVAQKYDLAAKDKEITLTVTGCEEPCLVKADIGLIERVLDNLISNAIKYTDSGGRVALSLNENDGRVQVAVEDTGVGIPAEDLSRIFERFYRSPGSISAEGSGLGLAIARRIVELHDGEINVSSKPGQGSTFEFYLPKV